ncbi:twinkle mtDNA helicase-like [Argiope bruennichi]|uniref:twinkle mtDNA helicase-like n=1 Tax=Argiope bruennichi TaxID=94029 RepID=UPI002495824F|nr:twinkle mtDNA helicase-like [Argiope bruennichi]
MLQFQKFYINRTILALLQLKQPHMFRSIHLQVKLKRYLKEYPRYFSYASQNSLNLGNRFSSNIATNETEEKKINQRLLKSFVEAIAIGDLKVTDFAAVSDKFNLKDLDIQFVDKYDIRISSDLNTLMFPFYSLDGECLAVQSLSFTKEKKLLSDCPPELLKNILFGWPLIEHSQKKIIVTSDPLDALAVNQATNGINAISLPLDFKNFSVELLEALKPFTKIIFWLDPHLHDWDIHRLLGESLKEKAFFISSKNTSSALSSLQSGHNLERILNEAKPIYHKCLATFNTYRDSVREEIQGHEKTTGLKWRRFSILNDILKGHRKGELTIFSGQTGTGKTTFLCEYSLDLCAQGLPTLWANFEIPNVKLVKTMVMQFSKQNLIGQVEAFDHWAEKFEKIPMNFINFDGGIRTFEEILQVMERAVESYNVRHLVVDNLQYMLNMEDSHAVLDQLRRQDQIFACLREFACRMKCHVTLVIHPRKEPEFTELNNTSISGTAKAIQEADNILILQTTKTRQYLQVTKNRFDGAKGCVIVEFDKNSLTFTMKKAS